MPQNYETNSIVQAKVVKVKPFGAIVQLPDKSQGLIHISHVSNSFVQDINDFVCAGDVLNVKVLSFDEKSGKISLSLKDVEQERNNDSDDGESSETAAVEKSSSSRDYKPADQSTMTFEEKFKDWVRSSNERQAGLGKRNKRR